MAEFTERFKYDTNKISGKTVTKTAIDGTPDNEVVTLPLIAGKYVIEYSMEINFNGHKDTPILFAVTGDYAGETFSESVGASQVSYMKSRRYGFPKDVSEGTIITHGVEFADPDGTNGFVVNFCDVNVYRVA